MKPAASIRASRCAREEFRTLNMAQLTIAEAADRLRITREACKSRIHRGRALLREYLQGDESRSARGLLQLRGGCGDALDDRRR
jgi:DNA-directed RNA polymerase specialized sigma24 family protein